MVISNQAWATGGRDPGRLTLFLSLRIVCFLPNATHACGGGHGHDPDVSLFLSLRSVRFMRA